MSCTWFSAWDQFARYEIHSELLSLFRLRSGQTGARVPGAGLQPARPSARNLESRAETVAARCEVRESMGNRGLLIWQLIALDCALLCQMCQECAVNTRDAQPGGTASERTRAVRTTRRIAPIGTSLCARRRSAYSECF
jgi:hypothetical protein